MKAADTKRSLLGLIRNLLTLGPRLQKRFPLAHFIFIRFLSMLVILFFLGLAIFGLMQLAPGDMVENYVRSMMLNMEGFRQSNNVYTDEMVARAKHKLGLDLPFYVQYFKWLGNVVRGDLGNSLLDRAPILFLIRPRMINSLILNLISLVFLTTLSFLAGIYFSTKVGTKVDVAATFTALFLHAFPYILLLILLQLFASLSGWFPIDGYPKNIIFRQNPVAFSFSYLYHIFLPLVGAFLSGIGGTMRMIRATMLDQLGQPYITALRARGVPEQRIFFAHAFRNSLNPYITSSADLFASLFSGSLILEIIFSYPGIGKLMFEAVKQEDINLVLANMMFISFLILFGMLVADILLALVDPRIRYAKN